MQDEEVFQQYRPHASGKSQFNKVIDGMRELSIKITKLGFSFLVLEKVGSDRTRMKKVKIMSRQMQQTYIKQHN